MMYDELKREIEGAPATWIPGLVRAVVEAAVRKNVFIDGALVRFVAKTIERMKA